MDAITKNGPVKRRTLEEIAAALANNRRESRRKISSLLTLHRFDEAATQARRIRRPGIALEIYRNIGEYRGISDILVKRGDFDGAWNTYMDAGRSVSAMNLSVKESRMDKVREVADIEYQKYSKNLDHSPTLVRLLLKARDAAMVEWNAFSYAGFFLHSTNHTDEKQRRIEDTIRYEKQAMELGYRGIAHFTRWLNFYEAARLALIIKDDGTLLDVVRMGLDHQSRMHDKYPDDGVERFDKGFLVLASIAAKRVNDPAEREELQSEIARQESLRTGKHNGYKKLTPKEMLRCNTVALTLT